MSRMRGYEERHRCWARSLLTLEGDASLRALSCTRFSDGRSEKSSSPNSP